MRLYQLTKVIHMAKNGKLLCSRTSSTKFIVDVLSDFKESVQDNTNCRHCYNQLSPTDKLLVGPLKQAEIPL